jgi:hypothetical protein
VNIWSGSKLPSIAGALSMFLQMGGEKSHPSSQWRKSEISKDRPSGAKQVAGKGLNLREIREKHPAGAKAHSLFCRIYGTTKVVP